MTEPHTSGSAPAADGRTARTGRARAVRILVLTGVGMFLIDLTTKHLALQALSDSEPVRLLGGAVYLTLIRNSGAAFSLGGDVTIIFPLVTLLVVGWIGWLARKLYSTAWAAALGLVLGGALGNLADRIFRAPGPFFGHVVDMVSLFDDNGGVWPVFNVADTALVAGVGLAILLEATGRQRDGGRRSFSDERREGGRQAEGTARTRS